MNQVLITFFLSDGFTTDKLPIFKEAMYSLAFPAKGELVNVLITAYKDVCHFFAQIIWKPHKEKSKYEILRLEIL